MAKDLEDLRTKNEAAIGTILRALTAPEQIIFQRVIRFEMENRHLHSPEYMRPVRQIIEQAVRQEGNGR